MGVSDPYKSPKWQKMRLQILERDGWKCVACGDEESTLHVHHTAYQGNPWEVPEGWLQTLCEYHHEALGEHPKSGVWWKVNDGRATVFVHWCPKCGNQRFTKKGERYRCLSCSWSTAEYERVGFEISDGINVVSHVATESPVDKKAKSLNWLKGAIRKQRDSGVSEELLWSAVFPDRQFPVGLFSAPAVGEWKPGASADGAFISAADNVGGLAADFSKLGKSRIYSESVIEVCFPPGSVSAAQFLNRAEVRKQIEQEMERICGRPVTLEFIVDSRFSGAKQNGR